MDCGAEVDRFGHALLAAGAGGGQLINAARLLRRLCFSGEPRDLTVFVNLAVEVRDRPLYVGQILEVFQDSFELLLSPSVGL